ncbi:penicillin-binding protein 2 [soil metagenome]
MKRPKKSKPRNLRQIAFTRFMLVVGVFVLWIGGISVRLVHLQVTQHAWLRDKAVGMRQDVKRTRMLRGTIFDRNDRALAMSQRAKTLYANPSEIEDVDSAAKAISKALKMDLNELTTQLRQAKEGNKRYIAIAKKLNEDASQKVNKSLDMPDVKKADLPNFNGLHWTEDQNRTYPYQSLAAQVVGYSDSEDEGKAGIEQSQEEILHGALITSVQQRDRLGRVYDETAVERDEPSDIALTLDSGYQYMVEQSLERGVRNAGAKSGMVVVILPQTGEIIALANYPTFDPNMIVESAVKNIGNKAVQSAYAPGSVFKIVTYGSALEKHLFSPDDEIDSGNGIIEIANHTFTDSHYVGRVSYSQALAHSSNVCAIKTGMSVGREDFAEMVQKMGFGAKTGVELPAETSGLVRPVDKWNGDSLASMSIGYEIGVSALQMTSAFATIANDGIRVQPHIIKEIRHSGDAPKTVTKPQETRVISAETAHSLKKMLRQVILTGTGKRAMLSGYTAAGKTGTAWKVNAKSNSVDSSKYISSFIGMAPANNPEIVIGVIMDEPQVGARDGGMVAAPVFREIAQNLLQEMKIPTDAPLKPEVVAGRDIPEVLVAEVSKKGKGSKPENNLKAAPGVAAPEKEKVIGPFKPKGKKETEKKDSSDPAVTGTNRKRFAQEEIAKIET